MPGIAQRNDHQYANGAAVLFNGSVSTTGFWSKHCDDVSYNQLQKFWSELSLQARHELLRIDKQTLFEQARKNMYCSRCNGLLLEGFYQIVMYGKSLQEEGVGIHHPCNSLGTLKNQGEDDVQAPSVHPWGGLTTTRDGALTLLDCYIYTKSMKGLQNVFDSARARERERELLYPDACGGGGRGWISQAMSGYGRGHGTRETCALHTARLSVDTLVDFWSALGEETRQSLLRMKEEDFIERLMYRFDSKRFCRDCRRNVIREFKELKELKRMKRETHCTSWFCVADTTIQYEVSQNSIQADWHHTFIDTSGTYHHFEWAVGTGEGKSDILEFENVGLNERVQVNGLDLCSLSACYITLRAWKMDGRCSELSVKAHALKGQQCVHCRLVVGDGFVTITRGENIRRFFEHAEEAEEEEDDDGMDKDGNDLDGECTRPQKHAKSPELAREFLLDAATVMFKEQVEKAFREGTARQNAHSIFVSLALKQLEEQVHVACKEIITLEKQKKLLEEEEKEKREEEERKERRRLKEKEKKLRRKERLREKEKDREKKSHVTNQNHEEVSEELTHCTNEESNVIDSGHCVSEMEEPNPSSPSCLDIQDNTVQTGYSPSDMQVCTDGDVANMKDESESSEFDHLKHSCQKLKYPKEFELDSGLKWSDRRQFAVSENEGMVGKHEGRHQGDGSEISRSNNRLNKQLRNNSAKSNVRVGGPKFAEKFYCPVNRLNGRYDSHACNCNTHTEYRVKADPCIPRWTRETKAVNKSESASDISKPYYRVSKCTRPEYVRENFARPKNKITIWSNASNRDSPVTKKVWEPTDSQKYPRSNSDSNLTLRSTLQTGASDTYKHLESSATNSSDEVSEISVQMIAEEKVAQELIKSSSETDNKCHSSFDLEAKSPLCMKEVADEGNDLCQRNLSSIRGTSNLSTSSSSNSDNCSSCLSEGDSNTSSSNLLNPESSSTSDSEESSQNSEGRDTNLCLHNGFNECQDEVRPQKIECVGRVQDVKILAPVSVGTESLVNLPPMLAPSSNSARLNATLGIQPQAVLPPPVHNQNVQFPMFQHPTMGYYYQSPVSLAAAPANGLMQFPHSGQYLFGNPYGYGLNGSTPFMHYGALQHTSQPLYNSGCLPVFQSTAQTKGINSSEHAKGTKENHHEDSVERTSRTGLQATEAAPTSGTTGKSSKFDVGNPGFSLFAFSDPASVKEGIAGNFSQNLSMHRTKGDDHDCNKKLAPPVEEYNPFANGIKFSFADIVI